MESLSEACYVFCTYLWCCPGNSSSVQVMHYPLNNIKRRPGYLSDRSRKYRENLVGSRTRGTLINIFFNSASWCMCLQALPLCGSSPSGFEYRQNQNQPMADLPQCFLNNSPRVSPRHTTPNGPINKVRQTDLSTHRSLFSMAMSPPKHFLSAESSMCFSENTQRLRMLWRCSI